MFTPTVRATTAQPEGRKHLVSFPATDSSGETPKASDKKEPILVSGRFKMPVDDTDDDVSCATPLQVTLQDIVTSHEMIDVGVVHVPIEQIQIIQKLFEVYDFVKRHEAEGRKWTAHNESSVPQGTPSTSPQKRASHSTAPNYFEKIIALDEEERRRRKSEVTSAAPLASSKRKKSELESSVGSSSTIADIEEQNTISNLIQQLSALPPFDDIKDLFKAKIKAMEDWRQYQYLTLKEQEADTAASRKKTAHGNPIVYFSSIGVPLLYFANYIIGPFYESFFPVSESKDRLKHDTEEEDDDTPLTLDNLPLSIYQPQQARQVVKVFRLFQTLDSNSDGYVSWDDFSQFIVQTGERFLLHSDVVAESSGKAHSGAALSYPLQFIDRPTNRNAWQAQHPLVYYLYHTVPFHKFIASDRSKNYFTGSIDGLVKLWRPDPQLVDRNKKVAIVHERNLLSVPSPITDMCLSPIALGDSEVIAVSAMDGTISFIRATNGEVIRTMLGVRSSNEEQVRALGEIYSKRPGGVQKQRQEFEADDLLSLRQRPTAASGTVVRQPYTIPAYREEALEIFFGKVNRYFKSMEVLAPTYSHLKRPIATASDVLYSFGATHLSGRSGKGDQVDSWFASSVALGYVTPSTSSFQILKGGAYLFLGFETGTLMAYELNINWFSVSHLNATRVEPPTSRHPVYSTVAHESNISGIVISESNQFLLTISDDATVRIRNLNRIETPLVELGTVCLNDIPKQNLFDNEEVQTRSSSTKNFNSHTARIVCSCWSDEHNLLATGGMDYMVFLWTPRASVKPYRHIDLRELQRSHEALFQLGVCGYPVDVSFMNRSGDPLRLIVLDSRRIIRILNAFSGELITVLSDDSASSVALGDMLVARYDPMDDRLLLGGKCLRVWEMRETDEHERNYTGHRKPVLYVTWHPTLNVFVTADEDHVVLWKIRPCVNQLAVERRQKRREMRKKIKEAAKLRATKEKKDLQLAVKDGEEEEKKEEEQNTSLSTSLMSDADPLTEVDEVMGISPTLCEDFNFFNHTYWSFETIIARSINIEEGVRTVTVDPSSTSVNIFVGLMRERAILHYNGFTGAKLRKFAYPDEVQELFCLTVGDVLLSRATAIPSPVLCAAFERYPKRGVAAVYHLIKSNDEVGDPIQEVKKSPTDATERPENCGDLPHRQLVSKMSPISSILLLKSRSLLVYGGLHKLYATSTKESTTFATPMKLLSEVAPVPSNAPVWTALFPGRLVPNPVQALRDRAALNTSRRSRSKSSLNASVKEETPAPVETASTKEEEGSSETYYADAQESTSGHIGHILQVPGTPYLFSGNNVGLLQLWNLDTMSEVMRVKMTLGNDTITSLSLSPFAIEEERMDGFRNLHLAVGDQWGYIVMLDLSYIPFLGETPLDEISNLEGSIVVLDRWRGHRRDVRGLQFLSSRTLSESCTPEDVQAAECRYDDFTGPTPRATALQNLVDKVSKTKVISLKLFEEEGCADSTAPQSLDGEEQVRRSVLLADPITLVSAGEDDAVLVWKWHLGALQCMGSFGAGTDTKITPPLSSPSYQCMSIFEAARRFYVLQRLVEEVSFFYINRTAARDPRFNFRIRRGDLNLCLNFMEWELRTLLQEDPVRILASWGSLSWRTLPVSGSFTNWLHHLTSGSHQQQYADGAKADGASFNMGGLLGSFDWLGEPTVAPVLPSYMTHRTEYNLANIAQQLEENENGEEENEEEEGNEYNTMSLNNETGKEFSSCTTIGMDKDGTSSVGTFRTTAATIGGNMGSRPRARRTESSTQPSWRNVVQTNVVPRSEWKTTSSSPYVFAFVAGSYLDSTVEDCLRRTVDAVKGDIIRYWQKSRPSRNAQPSVAEKPVSAVVVENSPMTSDGRSTARHASETPMGNRGYSILSQTQKLNEGSPSTGSSSHRSSGEGPNMERRSTSAPPAAPLPLRGEARQPIHYKVSYGASDNLVHHAKVGSVDALPSIVARPYRKQMRDNRTDPTGSPNSPLNDNLNEGNFDDPVQSPAQVMQEAYKQRRQEDALKRLGELDPHELRDRLTSDAGGPTRDQKNVLLQAGLVHGLANYDDFFATTGTRYPLYGEEKRILSEQQGPKKGTKVSAAFLEGMRLPGSMDGTNVDMGEDWYTQRDRNIRQKRKEDRLWNPSNIMLTLMDWEAPRPESPKETMTTAIPEPPIPEKLAKSAPKKKFALPSLLPSTLPTSEAVVTPEKPEDTAPSQAWVKDTHASLPPKLSDQLSKDGEKDFSSSKRSAEEVERMRSVMREAVAEREQITSLFREEGTGEPESLNCTINSQNRSQLAFQRKPRYK